DVDALVGDLEGDLVIDARPGRVAAAIADVRIRGDDRLAQRAVEVVVDVFIGCGVDDDGGRAVSRVRPGGGDEAHDGHDGEERDEREGAGEGHSLHTCRTVSGSGPPAIQRNKPPGSGRSPKRCWVYTQS